METPSATSSPASIPGHLHVPRLHLSGLIGNGWFRLKARALARSFARSFGLPIFLAGQTVVVTAWIVINLLAFTGRWHFDDGAFILLNLALGLHTAYAAPLLLLVQARRAGRDIERSGARPGRRESLAWAAMERRTFAAQQTTQLLELMARNHRLAELSEEFNKRIEMQSLENSGPGGS